MIKITQKDIIQKLDAITSDYDFIYVISAIILRDFCGSLENLGKRPTHDFLNYNEASFLIGLWIKNVKTTNKTKLDLNSALKETDSLLEQLHFSILAESPNPFNSNLSPTEFMLNGARFKEAFFYAATGAYDFQYVEKAALKYQYDEEWIHDSKKFSTKSLVKYFKHIKECLNKNLNTKGVRRKGISNEDLLNVLCLSLEQITNGNKEYENITSHFTIELESGAMSQLKSVGDFNEFQTKPIIKIGNNIFFIPMPFYLGEAIYESPFYWMIKDSAYRAKSLENRGKVAEEIVFNLFSNVFGKSNTFQGVKIKANKASEKSDIDVVGIYGDTAIIAQVKSKKLTSLSKEGNMDKIKEDFEQAIEGAFDQGLICKSCIENFEEFSFIAGEKKDIKECFSTVKKIYIICVVLDVFPALSHLSHAILYDKREESTICFSVFDLEVICNYLSKPNQLIDYFTKRINNCRFYYAENEMCFLGFYLETGLKKYNGYTHGLIDNDYGSKIDRMYYAKLSGHKEKTTIATKRKIGRNDLCPCESGKKYKNCHGKTTQDK